MSPTNEPDPVRWGILGAGRIAEGAVLPALGKSPAARAHAIAARDRDRAVAMAGRCSVEKAYGSYDALLADPAVEVVYVALPNHLHVEYARKAAEAGKHVLVEKPVALTRAELVAFDGIDPRLRTGLSS